VDWPVVAQAVPLDTAEPVVPETAEPVPRVFMS